MEQLSDGARAGTPADPVQEMIQARRQACDIAAEAPRWGLAFSGGGIRSATFCFGLLKALAQNGVLRNFDLLSTVSGGGYIGSTVGKLYSDRAAELARSGQASRMPPAREDMQSVLATADKRWFAWWLRANGRYLIPHGTRDLLFALASYSRNLVAVHFELALMAIALGVLLSVVDVGSWLLVDAVTASIPAENLREATLAWLTRWPTAWLLLPAPLWLGLVFGTAYWILPADSMEKFGWHRRMLAVLVLSALAGIPLAWDWLRAQQMPASALVLAWVFLAAWLAGSLVARVVQGNNLESRARARNRLTRWLAHMLTLGLVILLLGGIDYLAWHLATTARDHQQKVGVGMVVLGVLLRTLLPKLSELPRALAPSIRGLLASIYSLAGLLTLAGLVIFWVSLVHRMVTMSLFPPIDVGIGSAGVAAGNALTWAVLLGLPVLIVMAISAGNAEFLNRSSLHSFYRSRLSRSYLGATNGARFGSGVDATRPVSQVRRSSDGVVAVDQVHGGDDVAMREYAPQAAGGPVHLLNVCINQTRDPRGGQFNQDRKGILFTIGPGAWARVGQDGWEQLPQENALSLSSWAAISGAAVSPGLGSFTSPGVAALATMAGIRLGYWWQRRRAFGRGQEIGKYRQLLCELLGRFDGDRNASWFLSDGGHFENTGAYALLQERCGLIVVADCGADPRYAFADLENLVRKARIDMQAEVRFLKPRARLADGWRSFGSLNDIASAESTACLALAEIDYADGTRGHMIVVKPSICTGLPVDLVNFKADNSDFPQEATTDQSFDEAQWESYYQLGAILGHQLRADLLAELGTMAQQQFVLDDGMLTPQTPVAGAAAAGPAPVRRLPARVLATSAVTASISVGAIASLVVSAWQAIAAEARQREAVMESRNFDKAAFRELSEHYVRYLVSIEPNKVDRDAVVTLATALVRTGELTCLDRPGDGKGYQGLPLMRDMLQQMRNECSKDRFRDLLACGELRKGTEGPVRCFIPPERQRSCEPRYWIRTYARGDLNCRARAPESNDPLDDGRLTAAASTAGDSAALPPASGAVAGAVVAAAPELEVGGGSAQPQMGTSPKPASELTGTTGGAAAQVPRAAGQAKAQAPQGPCSAQRVYIQIYGPDMRDRVRQLREGWRQVGASVPPIEDVWHSAAQAGRARPEPVGQPTLILHDSESAACAHALVAQAQSSTDIRPWTIRPLPLKLKATRGVVEAWVPRLP